MHRPTIPLPRVMLRKVSQGSVLLRHSPQHCPSIPLRRNFHATRQALSSSQQTSAGSGNQESYANRVKKAWNDTPIKWSPIPIGLGLAFITFLQYRKIMEREAARSQDVSKAVVVGPWQGSSCTVGSLEEIKDPDLTHYSNLSEFFYRELKDGVRPIDKDATLVSPSDGRVFHFGLVDGSRVEQIKGMSYSLDQFLGSPKGSETIEMIKATQSANIVDEEEFAEVNGISYTLDSLLGHDQQPSLEHKRQDTQGNVVPDVEANRKAKSSDDREELKIRPGNKLFFCVVYLAPGDYHRFHSPANWVAETRRHFSGELYSVSPWMVKQLQDLFVLNERVVLLGRWRYGFISMVPVGATNVGSIVLNFDKELHTNRREDRHTRGYGELSYSGVSRLLSGQPLHAGEEMGGFKLGSTIVLVFEAPKNFKFMIEPGQRVKMGQALGKIE
ncbi:phosphatidylserine decarboxylase 1 [Modicella reniformis]|uniref:Phosphatidylserine decarboxylase proenzyme 1, mitochondrial n=1 Tax=Modicella reniformis TaxID=1440133 RepID=A0A9P6LUE9_9FUNG|nr:phosphatidylserine decarboxylase 1 [Modicella reniformis]